MKTRVSNIELLRILCALSVILHHLLVHGLHIYDASLGFGNYPWGYSLINQMCYVSVNVFILISGFFSIKFSWRKLLHLYLVCATVGGLCFLFHRVIIDGARFGRSALLDLIVYNALFPFSNETSWFITVYVYLFLLAPFINVALAHLSMNEFKYLLIALIAISCYFGWFWSNRVNPMGFCLMQFITMYVFGAFVSKYAVYQKLKIIHWGLSFVVLSCVGVLLNYLLQIRGTVQSWPPVPSIFAYNNPVLMAASICVLCMFCTMRFQNKVVNFLAASTLGVYLIPNNPHVFNWVLDISKPLYSSSIFGLIAAVLLIYSVSCIIDVLVRAFVSLLMIIASKLPMVGKYVA